MMITALAPTGTARADELSIYEIQYTADPNGASGRHGNIVDCLGGIVIDKSFGSRTKLTLYDPNSSDGWGGIMAKDRYGVGVFADVNVGDWMSFNENRSSSFLSS